MSHFTCGVIVNYNKDTFNIDELNATVNSLVAPYDEGLEVPEYDEQCSCVGQAAENGVYKQVNEELGDINILRKKFNEDHKELITKQGELNTAYFEDKDEDKNIIEAEIEKLDKEIDTFWQNEVADPRQARKAELLALREDKDSPDPECDECKGTGIYKTTYNPKSKWDWWSYGGRWNGALKGKVEDDGDGGFNFDPQYRQLSNNYSVMNEIVDDFLPFAIITPDGEWYEKGEMGWWGIVSDEKEDWKDIGKGVLDKYRDDQHVICLLNMHI